MSVKITEAEVGNVAWRLVEVTPHYRRSIGNGTHPVTGVPITVERTEYLAEDALLSSNAEERNDTDNQRWANDRNGVPLVKVASIPMNKFITEFAQHMHQGDKDFSKWWLKQERNQPFRTRKGSI